VIKLDLLFANVDLANLTFVGFMALGAVNVVTFFKPNLDSKTKFALSVVAALIFAFVPANWGLEITNRVKDAVAVAFAVSGVYKLGTKIGGN
jgi:hypothetical protein